MNTLTRLILAAFFFLPFSLFSQDWPWSKPDANDTTPLKKYKPHISGMLQVHYLTEFNTNGDSIQDPDGFRVLRARLTAEGKIAPKISYQIMIDPRAPEQRGILRDCYISFDFAKDQSIRVGQQKTQFGYENTQSIAELYVVNRSEMSDNLSRGVNLRDCGIGWLGKKKIAEHFRLDHGITFTNGSGLNVQGPWEFSSTKNLWAKAGLRYKKNDVAIRIGFSYGNGGIKDPGDLLFDPADDFFIRFMRYGTDVQMDHKWFNVSGEYAMGKETINDTLEDHFGYQVTLAGKTPLKFGPLFRYDGMDDEFKRMVVGLYYGEPKDRLRLLINYEFRGEIKDIPEGHDDRLYIQLQLCF